MQMRPCLSSACRGGDERAGVRGARFYFPRGARSPRATHLTHPVEGVVAREVERIEALRMKKRPNVSEQAKSGVDARQD